MEAFCAATRACGARFGIQQFVRVASSRLGRDTSDDSCAFADATKHQTENVIKTVAAKSFMDINSVKQVIDALRLVAEEEILAGRAFHFRGLCSLKLVTGARVEASAAQGRAFDAISVLGLAKLEE